MKRLVILLACSWRRVRTPLWICLLHLIGPIACAQIRPIQPFQALHNGFSPTQVPRSAQPPHAEGASTISPSDTSAKPSVRRLREICQGDWIWTERSNAIVRLLYLPGHAPHPMVLAIYPDADAPVAYSAAPSGPWIVYYCGGTDRDASNTWVCYNRATGIRRRLPARTGRWILNDPAWIGTDRLLFLRCSYDGRDRHQPFVFTVWDYSLQAGILRERFRFPRDLHSTVIYDSYHERFDPEIRAQLQSLSAFPAFNRAEAELQIEAAHGGTSVWLHGLLAMDPTGGHAAVMRVDGVRNVIEAAVYARRDPKPVAGPLVVLRPNDKIIRYLRACSGTLFYFTRLTYRPIRGQGKTDDEREGPMLASRWAPELCTWDVRSQQIRCLAGYENALWLPDRRMPDRATARSRKRSMSMGTGIDLNVSDERPTRSRKRGSDPRK